MERIAHVRLDDGGHAGLYREISRDTVGILRALNRDALGKYGRGRGASASCWPVAIGFEDTRLHM